MLLSYVVICLEVQVEDCLAPCMDTQLTAQLLLSNHSSNGSNTSALVFGITNLTDVQNLAVWNAASAVEKGKTSVWH